VSIWFVRPADLPEDELARELVGDDYGGIQASVIFVDAEPGKRPRLHKHAYPELFFVIEGQATFTDGFEERVVCAGEAVIVGPDQPHGFVNSGAGRLRQIDVHLNSRFVTEWLEATDDVRDSRSAGSARAEALPRLATLGCLPTEPRTHM
jgi:mannose-6-phosphate isomerase-like protein (cupin superfamily)